MAPRSDTPSKSDSSAQAAVDFAELGIFFLVLAIAALLFLSGCAVNPISDTVIGPGYHPSNVHTSAEVLPASIRRVAVLPMSADGRDAIAQSGIETFEPIFHSELGRTRAFEVIYVVPEQLLKWTGKSAWSAEERLPWNFFAQINGALNCDAVLFCRLTQYQPYQPSVIGWNLKLVGSREPAVWWSIDEVFNAGDFTVSNAARRFYQSQQRDPGPLADSRSILNSPSRFGQYTLAAVFSTLPARAGVSNPAIEMPKEAQHRN